MLLTVASVFNNADVFNKMNNAMFEFNKSLFSPSQKSFYDKQDMEILRDYRTIVPHGAFWRYDKEKPFKNQLVEIDINKAFTSAFVSIDRVPVFSEFDAWKRYDKHGVEKINDLTLYFVRCRFTNLMLNKQFGLVYGMFLKKNVDDVEIIAYKVPSHIYKVDYKKKVKKLWETDISSDDKLDKAVKKMIANINFGLLEKGNNIKSKSMIFNKMEDAVYYREKYGGKINVLIDEEKSWDEETESYVGKVVASYYVLTVSDEKRLTNGFRFLKELLLQHHNFKMNSVYKMFREHNINLYSVKTDAFVIKKSDLVKAKGLIEFSSRIGCWRVAEKGFTIPSKKYTLLPCKGMNITEFKNETLTVSDEWNTDRIIDENVLPYKRLMIRGFVAGTGKSHICKKMIDRGHKVLFVVPTNELGQECGCEWTTLNKFFGIAFGDEKIMKFDSSEFDVIVFDEIYFHNVGKWALIR